MAKELQYTSAIKDMPLMFSEMKRTALLLCENKTADEVVQLSTEKKYTSLIKKNGAVMYRLE